MKRWILFFGVNILIVVTISVIASLLGIGNYVSQAGLNYGGLFAFCLLWGMGGAFISLLMSKMMAKWMMGVQIVTLESPAHRNLVEKIHRLSRKAGLVEMPEVGIYQSHELNAFATGPSRNNSLVAVSTGLLSHMNEDELEGVLAHEVSHIANGDMVTMTLIQGIMNAFVMFFARIVAFMIDQAMRKDDDDRSGGLGPFAHMMVVMVLEMLFGFLAMFIIAWFSRYREYRADKGAADLSGASKMIMALESLKRAYPHLCEAEATEGEANFKSMQISSRGSWFQLLSTHPQLDDRIQALRKSVN